MLEDNNNNNNDLLTHIRKLPLVSDLKFRRFFSDTTPQTRHIMEVLLSYASQQSQSDSCYVILTEIDTDAMWSSRLHGFLNTIN